MMKIEAENLTVTAVSVAADVLDVLKEYPEQSNHLKARLPDENRNTRRQLERVGAKMVRKKVPEVPYSWKLSAAQLCDYAKLSDGTWIVRLRDEIVEVLTDYFSGSCQGMRDWSGKKEQSRELAGVMGRIAGDLSGEEADEWEKYANNVSTCGSTLLFAENEAGKKTLISGYFCHDVLCIMCNWRKSIKWTTIATEAVDRIFAMKEGYQFLHLVLTVPNCSVEDLRQTMDAMDAGLARMADRVWFKNRFVGYTRKMEWTISKNPEMIQQGRECHPHMHILLVAKEEYFDDSPALCRRDGRAWQTHLTNAFRSQQFNVEEVASASDSYQEFVCEVRKVVAEHLLDEARQEGVDVGSVQMWRTKYRKTFQRTLDAIQDMVVFFSPLLVDMRREVREVLKDVEMRGIEKAALKIEKRALGYGITDAELSDEAVKVLAETDLSKFEDEQACEMRNVITKSLLVCAERFSRNDFPEKTMRTKQASACVAFAKWLREKADLMYIDEPIEHVFLNEWRDVMDDPSITDVRLSAVKDDYKNDMDGKPIFKAEATHKAVKEVMKYVAKDHDYVIPNDPDRSAYLVYHLHRQLKGKHMLQYSGLFREVVQEITAEWNLGDDDGDLTHVGKGNGGLEGESLTLLIACWNKDVHAYVVERVPVTEENLKEMEGRGFHIPDRLWKWVENHPFASPPEPLQGVYKDLSPVEQRKVMEKLALIGIDKALKNGWDVRNLRWASDFVGFPRMIYLHA